MRQEQIEITQYRIIRSNQTIWLLSPSLILLILLILSKKKLLRQDLQDLQDF